MYGQKVSWVFSLRRAVWFKSSYVVVSMSFFFMGKTSDLSLSSLQRGRKKSLNENWAYPMRNDTS